MNTSVLTVRQTKSIGINQIKSGFVPNFHDGKRPTKATIEAMEETMNDIKNGDNNVFYDVDELMNDLLAN